MDSSEQNRAGIFPLLDRNDTTLTDTQRAVADLFPEGIGVPAFPSFDGLRTVQKEMTRYLQRLGIHQETSQRALEVSRLLSIDGAVGGFVAQYNGYAMSGTHVGGVRSLRMYDSVHGTTSQRGFGDGVDRYFTALIKFLSGGGWAVVPGEEPKLSAAPAWVAHVYEILDLCDQIEQRTQDDSMHSAVRTISYGLRSVLGGLDEALRTQNAADSSQISDKITQIREAVLALR